MSNKFSAINFLNSKNKKKFSEYVCRTSFRRTGKLKKAEKKKKKPSVARFQKLAAS